MMTPSTALTRERTFTQRQAAATFLPLAIRAADLPCLIVGGGRIGTRKATTLCRAGAKVTVLSPEISPRLREYVNRGQIEWRQSQYALSQINGFRLVVAATADHPLNHQIGLDAEREGILSCVVSSADSSRVIFPAVCNEGDISVAVHSHGRDCRQSQAVRNRIAVWLSSSRQLRKVRADQARCGKGPKCPVEGDMQERASPDTGRVYIIGAGPGAADLISLRGYHALRSADAILVDQLIPASFLEDLGISLTGKLVERLGSTERHWSQEEINGWLVATATSGQTVARLKGGDPFVFGRGDSEIESLADHGIPWEVIPGASAATAVLSSAGLPLTRHGQRRSFAVTTARVEGAHIVESFPRADSLVILMGVTVLNQVVSRLLADGWPLDTATAIVERGTLSWERQLSGPLCQLSELAQHAGVASPALVVVGEAARAVTAIHHRPTILFTGLDATNFRMLGDVLHWPAQAMVADPEGQRLLPRALAAISRGSVDWVVFTDKCAVRTFWAAVTDGRLDARVMGGAKIAALGAETVRQLERHYLWADAAIMEDGSRKAAAMLGDVSDKGVLVVQGSHTPRGLRRQLEEAGAAVNHLVLNQLAPHPELGRPLPNHDVIYFVSPAGVRAYAKTYGKEAFEREVWCLGKATQRALVACGVPAIVVRPLQPLLSQLL
jgi:uroporphyrin-III C-methyltransferase / precorrin-2 dehydrogenase / sirohydrochlorin ferrochelatase